MLSKLSLSIACIVFLASADVDEHACAVSEASGAKQNPCLLQHNRFRVPEPVLLAGAREDQQTGLWNPEFLESKHTDLIGLGGCSQIHLLLPLSSLFAVLFAVIVWHWCSAPGDAPISERARSVGLFAQFCGLTNYSIVIIEAYQLSKALNHGAPFSGHLIGIYMAAAVIGSLCCCGLLRTYPAIWKSRPRQVFLLAQMFGIAGFCVYASVTLYMTRFEQVSIETAETLSSLLLAARFVSGIGQGITSTLLRVTFAHITPIRDRPAQMTRFAFTSTLGIGLGPMIAACLRLLDFCPEGLSPRFELAGFAQLVLGAAALFSLFFYPELKDVEDFSNVSTAEARGGLMPDKDARSLQILVVTGCMLNTFARAMIASGVEGATSLILELEYKFPLHEIGMIIGSTFLCCYPVKLMIDYTGQRFTVFELIRALCSVSIFGSLLLYRLSWRSLVCADVLIFPSLYLSDGMMQGLMQQHAFSQGEVLDQTGTTFWTLLLHSIGRFLGPVVARHLLANVSQAGYASLQVILTVTYYVISEVMIMRPAQSLLTISGISP